MLGGGRGRNEKVLCQFFDIANQARRHHQPAEALGL
jgi:hypothetical protein